jgi:hypothetical protein
MHIKKLQYGAFLYGARERTAYALLRNAARKKQFGSAKHGKLK